MTYKFTSVPIPTNDPASILPTLQALRDSVNTLVKAYNDLKALMKQNPGSREKDYGDVPTKDKPWPLPECRLNEWTALINMKVARPLTMPVGNAVPFGAFFGLDIGTRWFNDVLNMGHTVKNFDITGLADHAWAGSVRSGHAALLKEDEYHFSEKVAREYLEAELKNQGV